VHQSERAFRAHATGPQLKRRAGLTGSCCRGAGHAEVRKRVRKGFQGRIFLRVCIRFSPGTAYIVCANQLCLKQRCPNHPQVWACAQGLKRAADRGSGGGGWGRRAIKCLRQRHTNGEYVRMQAEGLIGSRADRRTFGMRSSSDRRYLRGVGVQRPAGRSAHSDHRLAIRAREAWAQRRAT
jgi:hypothetical protein